MAPVLRYCRGPARPTQVPALQVSWFGNFMHTVSPVDIGSNGLACQS